MRVRYGPSVRPRNFAITTSLQLDFGGVCRGTLTIEVPQLSWTGYLQFFLFTRDGESYISDCFGEPDIATPKKDLRVDTGLGGELTCSVR